VIRELARCHQALEALNRAQLKGTGLTLAQFDIIATLGNTEGMNFKTLGEKTLITKGTLTGVVDRMERDGLVQRQPGEPDRRVCNVKLTRAGEQLFDKLFPAVVDTTAQAMRGFSATELKRIESDLARLCAAMGDFTLRASSAMESHLVVSNGGVRTGRRAA
jgi:DNA-binding MarR family transcriptional regulator